MSKNRQKLTRRDISQIRTEHDSGVLASALAEKYGRTVTTILRVISGEELKGARRNTRETAECWFWSKVQRSEAPDGCWVWTGAKNLYGYGVTSMAGISLKAHRISWILVRGDTKGLNVLHHCDNPPCVRPDHLWLGTKKDNSQDMARKGRARGRVAPGERNGRAKLSWDDVREIRAGRVTGLSYSQLATKFNVTITNIRHIIKGVTWVEP